MAPLAEALLKVALLAASVVAFAAAACHDVTGPPSVATVTVTPSSVVMVIGLTQPFAARLEDSAGNVLTGRSVRWKSDDTLTVTIDQGGMATAVGLGITTVIATSGGAVGTASVFAQFICKCAPAAADIGPGRANQCACSQ